MTGRREDVAGEGELSRLMAEGLATHAQVEQRINAHDERITRELSQHYVSYKGLWGVWWQAIGIAITMFGAGAAMLLAITRLFD